MLWGPRVGPTSTAGLTCQQTQVAGRLVVPSSVLDVLGGKPSEHRGRCILPLGGCRELQALGDPGCLTAKFQLRAWSTPTFLASTHRALLENSGRPCGRRAPELHRGLRTAGPPCPPPCGEHPRDAVRHVSKTASVSPLAAWLPRPETSSALPARTLLTFHTLPWTPGR